MPAPTRVEWLPTGKAVRATGLSRNTLHRWKSEGLLQEGRHYRPGLTERSPIRWNPEAIEQAITDRRKLPDRPMEAC